MSINKEIGVFGKLINKYGIVTTVVSVGLFVSIMKIDWITETISDSLNSSRYEVTKNDTLFIAQAVVWQDTDVTIRKIRTFTAVDYGEYAEDILIELLLKNSDHSIEFLDKDMFCASSIGSIYLTTFPKNEFNKKVISIILAEYNKTLTQDERRVETELRLTLVEAIMRSYQASTLNKLELILNEIKTCD